MDGKTKALILKARKLRLTWLAPIVVGVIVCIEARSLLSAGERRIEEPRYLIARRALPAGQPVTSIDFTLAGKESLGNEIPEGAMTDQELYQLHGAVTNQPLHAGECLIRNAVKFAEPPERLAKEVPRGLRAYPLLAGLGLDIRAGDKVDVTLIPADEKMPPFTLVDAALVLRSDKEGELVLAVSSSQVELLEKARRQGKLDVALRNPSDNAPVPGASDGSPRHRRSSKGHRSIEILSEGE